MKFTQVAADAFQKLQLNAGVLLTDFDPSTGALDRTKIFAATGGGVTFEATPTYIDFGEDIDNVPNNTMELKQLDFFEAKMTGTAKTVDTALAKALVASADVSDGTVTPRSTLSVDDFVDIWWVGDYSDVTTGDNAGFLAIKLINALSTGGFKIQSNDKGKGDFAFEFTGHYSLEDIDDVPFVIYIQEGENADATLASLAIGSVTLSPTFSKDVTSYTATTSNSTNTITATATDSTNATVVIKNGTTTVTSGNSATWSTGQNTVTVTVTNGTVSKVYTVVVTKSE